MMVCPQCKAEYRNGFAVCADCEVPLVPEYASNPNSLAAPAPVPFPGDPNEDPYCSFWMGDDPRLHGEICGLLDEESIPHMTIRREDHLFNLNNQPAFQIGVPFSRYERAEQVIHDAFGPLEEEKAGSVWAEPFHSGVGALGATAPRGLLASSEGVADGAADVSYPGANDGRPAVPWNPKGWFPEDATAEVWSADEPGLEEMLVASLEENEIHCRLDEKNGHLSLWVLPDDKERAREIIRQVEEGIAPE